MDLKAISRVHDLLTGYFQRKVCHSNMAGVNMEGSGCVRTTPIQSLPTCSGAAAIQHSKDRRAACIKGKTKT